MAQNSGVIYLGQNRVEVQSIDFPTMKNPDGKDIKHGVILKVVATNICGSDGSYHPSLVTKSLVKSSKLVMTLSISKSVTWSSLAKDSQLNEKNRRREDEDTEGSL